jgi:hypothetical protein
MTNFILSCLKRQITEYHGKTIAESKESLPELSSLKERPSGVFFTPFYGSFWAEKVSKNS